MIKKVISVAFVIGLSCLVRTSFAMGDASQKGAVPSPKACPPGSSIIVGMDSVKLKLERSDAYEVRMEDGSERYLGHDSSETPCDMKVLAGVRLVRFLDRGGRDSIIFTGHDNPQTLKTDYINWKKYIDAARKESKIKIIATGVEGFSQGKSDIFLLNAPTGNSEPVVLVCSKGVPGWCSTSYVHPTHLLLQYSFVRATAAKAVLPKDFLRVDMEKRKLIENRIVKVKG